MQNITPGACALKFEEKIYRTSLQSLNRLRSPEPHYKVINNAATITSSHRDILYFFFFFAFEGMQERDPQTSGQTDLQLYPSGQQLFLMLPLVCKALYVASSYVTAKLLMLLRTAYVGQSVRRGKRKEKLHKTE